MQYSLTLAATLLASACSVAASSARAESFRNGAIEIDTPWSRATPPTQTVGGGFMVITNHGSTTDTLLTGSTTLAAELQIHTVTMTDGVMRMRPLDGGLVIEPGQSVVLQPGGYHLMFIGLGKPLQPGDSFDAVLHFEHAGDIAVRFDVQPAGATSPPQRP
ncbi:MAG: copper chaperone PCu(A)C [Gammaproteobacteria bacterium]|nr:copper chaperone PCu(A)C [Gammaproteobacteria bacterium]